MSRTRYKIHMRYDSNMGRSEELDIYRICYNSCDTQHFYDEDGYEVVLNGTDSFIEIISKVLTTYEEGEYFNPVGEGFSVKEICYNDLPDRIKDHES